MSTLEIGDIWKMWITNVRTGEDYRHLLVLDEHENKTRLSPDYSLLIMETGQVLKMYGVDVAISGERVA